MGLTPHPSPRDPYVINEWPLTLLKVHTVVTPAVAASLNGQHQHLAVDGVISIHVHVRQRHLEVDAVVIWIYTVDTVGNTLSELLSQCDKYF